MQEIAHIALAHGIESRHEFIKQHEVGRFALPAAAIYRPPRSGTMLRHFSDVTSRAWPWVCARGTDSRSRSR